METVEVPPSLAWKAIANDTRHWKPEDIEKVRSQGASWQQLLGKATIQVQLGKPIAPEPILSEATTVLEQMSMAGINLLPLDQQGYPKRLAGIADPPIMLYSVGTLLDFTDCVAITGTRKVSAWGKRTAHELGRAIAQGGWTVTSGLALGVDSAAHRGAISTPEGRTVAVSALTLDRVYPPENGELSRQIIDRGAIVTEHALPAKRGKYEFVRRNRIISGLSFAHFVVESGTNGGTIHQARHALDQGRPLLVMVPPSGEREANQGFDKLVGMGARPCKSIEEAIQLTYDIVAKNHNEWSFLNATVRRSICWFGRVDGTSPVAGFNEYFSREPHTSDAADIRELDKFGRAIDHLRETTPVDASGRKWVEVGTDSTGRQAWRME